MADKEEFLFDFSLIWIRAAFRYHLTDGRLIKEPGQLETTFSDDKITIFESETRKNTFTPSQKVNVPGGAKKLTGATKTYCMH